MSTGERRIRRLTRWYPRTWRDRYGDEFAQLLADDLAERSWSWKRTADVALAGLRAWLAAAGLAAHPIDPAEAGRAGIATLAACIAVAGTAGVAMWSQLAIGLQWSPAPDPGITQAFDLMSLALLMFAVLAALAATRLLASSVAAVRRRPGALALALAGAVILVVGGRHVENGWPGTGGHLLLHQTLMPGGVAAFGWAVTLWVSSYWAHPVLLAAFPLSELAWMAVTPIALGAVVTGAVQLWRSLEHSPRDLRYALMLTRAGWVSSLVFGAGALRWLLIAAPAGGLFHAGFIDQAVLAVLGTAVAVGAQASRRAGVA